MARRDDAPTARRHFTRLDQVTQLVGASEADAELGFMARLFALCSLPRTNPRNRLRYVRRNGPYTLIMTAGSRFQRGLFVVRPTYTTLAPWHAWPSWPWPDR